MMKEQIIWSDQPSQMIGVGHFVFYAILSCFLLVAPPDFSPVPLFYLPIILAFWQFLVVQHTGYELTTERIITHTGIFTRTIDELELYRVKDFRIQQPVFLRIFGLANIVLLTSDITTPTLVIYAIPNARDLLNKIRGLVEYRRDLKGIRAVDIA